MTPTNDPHPSSEQLAAFRLDRLPAGERSAVEAHLAHCDTCREQVAPKGNGQVTLPDASLLSPHNPASADTDGYTALLDGSSATNAVPAELANHPRYRILGLLGAGGMGTVYKAQHLLMERVVALKVLRKDLTDRPVAVERFRQEVKAAARLAHPNIVAAYDADNAGELHFLITEYVEGRSLDRVLAEGQPVAVPEACEWVRQAALGLQHAYERGMVHRDIKPHNLMLTQPGGVVKVLDFGLARLVSTAETAEGLTPLGTVVGTPAYMAPEQMFSPLTGGFAQRLEAQQQQPAPPIRRVRKEVPAELEAVLRRMMARDPTRRYQTPAEVAAALTPFARGEKQPERRHGLWRPVLVAGVLLVLAILGGLGWLLLRPKEPADGEQTVEALNSAGIAIERGVLKKAPDEQQAAVRVIGGKEFGPFNRVAFSADGRLALSANEDFSVGLWDLDAGKEVARLKGHTNNILALAFSPSRTWAVSGGQDKTICVWDMKTRKLAKTIKAHQAWVRGLAFLPDETHVLAGDNHGVLVLWDWPAGKIVKVLQKPHVLIWCVAVSPTGSKALSGGWDEKVTVWDLGGANRLATLSGHKQTVSCVVFSSDGHHILSGSADMTLRLWSLETYKEERRFEGHKGGLNGVALSKDGRRALSAGNDGTVRLWDVASARQVSIFRGHGGGVVLSAAFLPDGRHAISGGRDGTFRIWRLPSPD